MSENEKILKTVDQVGAEFLIREIFLGYKYRKDCGILYDTDSDIPEKLISLYYGLKPDDTTFDCMKKAFVRHYIRNESEIEGINDKSIHGEEEMKGLEAMYDYIHSEDVNYLFDVYTLKDLNRMLFSFAPFPEYAGEFRNYTTFLPTTGTDLCPWEDIRFLLENVDVDVQKLVKKAPLVKNHNDMNAMLEYLDDSVEVMCKLIKIHPFGDGNGRTIRGFTNKLFEDAGLPPIYIKANERTEYHKAMNLANNENDYTAIKQFYRYKVCDSIIELDINERLKKEEKPKQMKKAK